MNERASESFCVLALRTSYGTIWLAGEGGVGALYIIEIAETVAWLVIC
jgi:hypothetical protein